jgi:hypothetical protein
MLKREHSKTSKPAAGALGQCSELVVRITRDRNAVGS